MRILKKRFVRWILNAIVGLVFVYAGAIKIQSPQNFADSIATFAMLPNYVINLLALALPPFEIIAGLAVITGIRRRPALLGLNLLMLVFIAALASAIARGKSVDCGCFGSGKPSPSSAWLTLGRDVALFCVGVALYVFELRAAEVDVLSEPQNRAESVIG